MVLNGILKQHSTNQTAAETQRRTSQHAHSTATRLLRTLLLVVLLLRRIATILRLTIPRLAVCGLAVCRLAISLRWVSLLLRVTPSILLLLRRVLVTTISTTARTACLSQQLAKETSLLLSRRKLLLLIAGRLRWQWGVLVILHGVPTSRSAASTLIFFGLETCCQRGVGFDIRVVVGFVWVGFRVGGVRRASAGISWWRTWGTVFAAFGRIDRLGRAIPR
jgi:hypothetical protein